MHHESHGVDILRTPQAEDFRDQGATMNLVLSLFPQGLTYDELVRELLAGEDEFEERDRVERAVRELLGAGLLQRIGKLVLPTRAAVHFHGIGGC